MFDWLAILRLIRAIKKHRDARFWWRDDDPGADFQSPRDLRRLEKTLRMLSEHGIAGIFACVPKNFAKDARPTIRILKKYGALVAVHGLCHKNNMPGGGYPRTEFPDGCDVAANLAAIKRAYSDLRGIFGEKCISLFVPPHNNVCAELKSALEKSGFAVSCFGGTDIDARIDFYAWHRYKRSHFKGARRVVREIIAQLESGRKIIGFNAHFWTMTPKMARFFRQLFRRLDWAAPDIAPCKA